MGFSSLSAFDFVAELVAAARRNDVDSAVDFRVDDATKLSYPDSSFEQAIYLQQLICFLDGPAGRTAGAREAFRILKPGGVAIFSFLGFEARRRGRTSALVLNYLRAIRAVCRSNRDIQTLPWLKFGGKINWGALLDRGPFTYWFRIPEVHELLTSVGFEIFAAGVGSQIARGVIHESCAKLAQTDAAGTIYVACRKPLPPGEPGAI